MEKVRKCTGKNGCGLEKNISEFSCYFDSRANKELHSYTCKECNNINNTKYYFDNKEIRKAKEAERRRKNIDNDLAGLSFRPILNNKICTGCNIDKNIDEFYFDPSRNNYGSHCYECKNKSRKKYYDKNKEEILKSEKTDKNKREKAQKSSKKSYLKNKAKRQIKAQDPEFKKERNKKAAIYVGKIKKDPIKGPILKIRNTVTKSITKALKSQNGSKNNESILKYVPYKFKELKIYIESLWEPWMNWDNYGIYKLGGERKWHIDHIIPQSELIYNSMDHINFQRSWALANLRPLDAIENIKKGDKISDELKVKILVKIDAELEERANNDSEFRIILNRLNLEEIERNNKKVA
jgi:hypothetical protein